MQNRVQIFMDNFSNFWVRQCCQMLHLWQWTASQCFPIRVSVRARGKYTRRPPATCRTKYSSFHSRRGVGGVCDNSRSTHCILTTFLSDMWSLSPLRCAARILRNLFGIFWWRSQRQTFLPRGSSQYGFEHVATTSDSVLSTLHRARGPWCQERKSCRVRRPTSALSTTRDDN